MIAKRVVQALRRQDWTMVAIEFVLVVVGVLLAFQINDASIRRSADVARYEATERLLLEAEESVAYLRLAVSNQTRLVTRLNDVLARLERRRWLPADEASMSAALQGARSALPLAPPSSAYDDLVSSGGLSQLDDTRLRSAIGKYRATLVFEEQMRQQLRDDLPRYTDHPAYRALFTPHGERRVRLTVNFGTLVGDEAELGRLAYLAEQQRIMLVLRARALKHAQRMCVELGRYVDRRCDLRLPPPTFD